MRSIIKILKGLLKAILILIGILFIVILIFRISAKIDTPDISNAQIENLQRTQVDSNFYYINNNWLQKNKFGLWEMYIEGDAYERGVINGKLAKELIYKQEKAFVDQIKIMIPSESYLKFLRSFIAFFNRNIDEHIIDEYQKEIYGISLSTSDEFNFVAPNYQRMLNYHAAHDIGHTLQNMNLVACTAFSGWDSRSADSSLIIGRNFDFYVGDEFAEDKLIMFCNPEKGHKFMIITWGSMIGATSGMNDQGLTVTLNAAKSEIPFSAATPVSLVAREILQYASTIDEAYQIAKKRKMFVSESLLIGSAKDGRTATIEKSPDNQALYKTDDDYIICSNHFQSNEMKKEEFTNAEISDYATTYRLKRVEQLLNENQKLDVNSVVKILRDQKGLNNENIGIGNEKAVNQLIAHHSVIFKPEELKFWVSTSPFQLGEFVCYDLNKVFNEPDTSKNYKILYESDLTLPADTFLYSKEFKDFNRFKELRASLQNSIKKNIQLNNEDEIIAEIKSLNPEFFETYVYIGDYLKHFNMKNKAISEYSQALQKEIPNIYQRESIEEKIKEIKNKDK